LVLSFAFNSTQENLKAEWNWVDDFSETEKEKLISWVSETQQSVKSKIGNYPFVVHYYFHKISNAKEPVPWAHTKRYPDQEVHFHVDPNFSLQEFINDWTAPHEISHLALPFLGKTNSWFAEGFASFMQYQIMKEMGIINQNELNKKFKIKFDENLKSYDSDLPMIDRAKQIRKKHNYPGMYWGGASFFYAWNQKLSKESNTGLCQLFDSYLQCCRMEDKTLEDIVYSLDRISGKTYGVELLTEFKTGKAKSTVENLRKSDLLP